MQNIQPSDISLNTGSVPAGASRRSQDLVLSLMRFTFLSPIDCVVTAAIVFKSLNEVRNAYNIIGTQTSALLLLHN